MSVMSVRTVKPVHLAAVVTLVAAGTWGGTALAASPGGDDKPAVARTATARAVGPAYVYKTKEFSVSAGGVNNAQVMCPNGYKVSGGGVQTGNAQLLVNETRPIDGNDSDGAPDDGWISYVINPTGDTSAATVYAVCAKV